MEQPFVTILIPVYNAGPYLVATLNSISNQSYPAIEIICINDGSTDTSGFLLDSLAATDERISVMHIANKGIVNALNLGLKKARGSLIARMDADDLSDFDRIRRQVDYMQRHREIGLLGSQVLIATEDGLPIKLSQFPDHHEAIESVLLKGMCPISHPAIMVRREVYDALEGYRDCTAEDYDLFLRACEVTKIANLPEVLLQYRSATKGIKHTALEANSKSVIQSLQDALTRRGMDSSVIHDLRKQLDTYGKRMRDGNALARKHLGDAWHAGNPATSKILGRSLLKKGGHNRKTLHRWLLAEALCLLGKKNKDSIRLTHG